MLILGGAMSTGEAAFRTITLLEGRYRIISPTYPVVTRLSTCLDGLAKILDAEGLSQAHVYGHSLGSGVAHALVRRHAGRIDKLILSSFGLYNQNSLKKARQALLLFRLLPYGYLSSYYKKRLAVLMQGLPGEDYAFYLAYTYDMLDLQLNKRMVLSQFSLLEDMFSHPEEYQISQPVDRRSRVLILSAKDDTGFAPDEQAALHQTYPGAIVHQFEAGGHLSGLTHQAEFQEAIEKILAGD